MLYINKTHYQYLGLEMRRKIAEESKHQRDMREEIERRKLQELLNTDVEDPKELDKMRDQLKDDHYK